MGITNGTFDTNLSGWILTPSGNADIIWDSGRARLRVYKCSDAIMEQTFVIDGDTISFDFETVTDGWGEIVYCTLKVDGTEVEPFIPFPYGYITTPVSGSKTIAVSAYIGRTATLSFKIIGSSYCGAGDHANTYLWIDNVVMPPVVMPPCVPNWQCEQPLNGYESDGCGNRRLNPACSPITGSISFTSTPQGARIYIGEVDTGMYTPAVVTNVPVGTHAYRLTKWGYYDYVGTIDVIVDVIANVSVSLVAMVTGCQVFNSVPAKSRIVVDNIDFGIFTPIKMCGIPLGTHTYRLEGKFDIEERGRPGQIFMSVPRDSTLYLDGIYIGITPEIVHDILPGTHTYRLEGTFTV